MFAEVVFNLPLEKSFHYSITDSQAKTLRPGMRVMAPFGARRLVGTVLSLIDKSSIPGIKPIQRIIDPVPLIADERWDIAQWMHQSYACSYGEALAAMMPAQLRLKPMDMEQPTLFEEPQLKIKLNKDQEEAFGKINSAIQSNRYEGFLLFGVTGSGKTELYLRAIAESLRKGKTAICLIPEISLTPQTIERFKERFGDTVAVWNSRLSTKERGLVWQGILNGSKQIVVGARSAIFAPLKNIGTIIIDEEHEQAYKQEDVPRYHSREVAEFRAQKNNAVLLMGSATPSIESFYGTKEGKWTLLHLPDRVGAAALSRVDVLDMRGQFAKRRSAAVFSPQLRLSIEQALEANHQVLLLLNRRGFSRVAQCQECGYVLYCRRCAIPLIYHASAETLLCHYCGYEQKPSEDCPECDKGQIKFKGIGTEKIESELHRYFPQASIARMDADTTKDKEAHQDMYDALRSEKVNLLVGTQMIAKGHHFPNVTLVGVISADTSLNLPDFRAGERTFDLLTQVAGRAGRGDHAGKVLIQTFNPDHYAIQCAAKQDYEGFYAHEIQTRKDFELPPFFHFIELLLKHSQKDKVFAVADLLATKLKGPAEKLGFKVLGPAPHRIPKLKSSYRVSLILKGKHREVILKGLKQVLAPGRKFEGLPVVIDVNPS